VTEAYDIRSPDAHGSGLVDGPLHALRYDIDRDDPIEVEGLLRGLMPENVRVLDVGCGTGAVTAVVNRGKHNQILAIEPDKERAAVASARGFEVYGCFLDQDFLSEKGPFDVIMMSDVLEHLASPDEMLHLAIGGLKPDGILLLSVPNVAHWTIRLKLLFGSWNYAETGLCDATHLRWFTERSFMDLLTRRGLKVVALQRSAGTTLSVYQSRVFRFLPRRVRRQVVRVLTAAFPRLFACQFVVKAQVLA
jgi:2-polyprenyl-3-methyl-5-hydroxy-6-metoxy-1,4-benzoquinol methylase